ncbi:MAG: T9SS type A sorting domain-containing protein, partial [Chlorobi bacterium]|nr:T9SS type A sorting domain-containing protein [Chlorobiota bacterium]
KGAGMWALGYDDGYAELWQTLENKFGNPNSVNEITSDNNVELRLDQNYPNPFGQGTSGGNSTTILYGFPNGELTNEGYVSNISLKIFNALGEEVAVIIDEKQFVGFHKRTFSMNANLPSGVYFYTLNSNGVVLTKKMVYLK